MTKCDFCTQSNANGKCFFLSSSLRSYYCEEAIKRMIKALGEEKVTEKKKRSFGKNKISRLELMAMPYTVYSDFDIEQHKKTFIHYLEVVIDENGKIMYAVPSHQEKMISLACEKLNATREELNAMCPQEYYCDFVTWLCKMSSACAVWENFIECDKLTEQQIRALQMLKENGLYLGKIPRTEG